MHARFVLRQMLEAETSAAMLRIRLGTDLRPLTLHRRTPLSGTRGKVHHGRDIKTRRVFPKNE